MGYELLVVDDASPDNTREIVHTVDAPNLVYLRQPQNAGVNQARNRAIAEAKGKYIVFLDDDDRFEAGFLAAVADALQDAPDSVGFALPGRRWVHPTENGDVVLRATTFGCEQPEVKPGAAYLADPIGGSSGLILNTQFAREISGFDTAAEPARDTDLLLRAAARADFMIIPNATLIIQSVPGQQMTKNRKRVAQAVRRLADVHADLLAAYPRTRCRFYRNAARLYYDINDRRSGRAALVSALRVAPLSYKTWGLFGLLETARFLPPSLRRRIRVHSRHG